MRSTSERFGKERRQAEHHAAIPTRVWFSNKVIRECDEKKNKEEERKNRRGDYILGLHLNITPSLQYFKYTLIVMACCYCSHYIFEQTYMENSQASHHIINATPCSSPHTNTTPCTFPNPHSAPTYSRILTTHLIQSPAFISPKA
jgi:hypothetical protein